MSEKDDINKLETTKRELIERAKRQDRAIYGRDCEMKALQSILKSKKHPPAPGKVRREIEGIDFRIATEAYTLKHERDLLKKIKTKKAELKDAVDFARKKGRLRRLEQDIVSIRKEREKTEVEIQEVKKKIIMKRRKGEKRHFGEVKKRRKAAVQIDKQREMKRYLGKGEALELGDVAVIRKKDGGERG